MSLRGFIPPKKIIILGTGGYCVDILDAIREISVVRGRPTYECIGFLDDDEERRGQSINGVPVLGPLNAARQFEDAYFVCGIGNEQNFWKRDAIIATTGVPLHRFESIVHPTASVSRLSSLGSGVVILQNVTVNASAAIGNHVLILPNAVVSHDAEVGDYCCVTSGACISGGVHVGRASYLGANSTIIGDVSIGDQALVGMGSVVLESVEANVVVAGNPARFLRVTVEPETNGATSDVVEQEGDGTVSDVADLDDASAARDPARLSVVLPVLNEEQNVVPAVEQVTRTLDAVGYDWDLVLVDDGSRDGTFAAMRACAAQDSRIRSIRLSRTFGSHVAITAGLAETSGEACVVMTPDLEEPPEMIPAFVQKWREGCDVVWGIPAKRNESIGMRIGSQLFRVLFRLFGVSEHSEPAVRGGFFLISRRVADALRAFKERNRTLVGLLSWLGFSQGLVEYAPDLRPGGRSKWTFARRAKLAADSFVSVSYVPIRAIALLGIGIALVSAVYVLWMIAVALTRGGAAVQGSQALLAAVLFLGGLQLLASGMIGEYIWRALDEARGRPLYVIADRVGGPTEETAVVHSVAIGVGSNADGARP